MTTGIPTHIITGFLGVGKTTTLNALLAQLHAQGEQVLVVINEMGAVGVDGALIEERHGHRLLEITGGCMCCALRVILETKLAQILRKWRPQRILIEPTGVGHPQDLLSIITRGSLAQILVPGAHTVVVDAQTHGDERVRRHPLYDEQWSVADWIAVSKEEISDPALLANLRVDAAGASLPLLAGGTRADLGLLAWPPAVAEGRAPLQSSPVSAQHDHDDHGSWHGYRAHFWPQRPGVPLTREQLTQYCSGSAVAALRCKGILDLGIGQAQVQLVRGQLSVASHGGSPASTLGLTVIAADDDDLGFLADQLAPWLDSSASSPVTASES